MKTPILIILALALAGCRPSDGITFSARQIDLITSPISDYDYPETTLGDRYPHDVIFKILSSDQIVTKILQDPNLGLRIRSKRVLDVLKLPPSSSDSELIKRLSISKEVTWADKEQALIRIRFKEVQPDIESMLCELHLVAYGRFYRTEK